MTLNVVLFLLIIVLTVAVALWFTIDYKRAKAGKKSFLWERKSNTRHERDTQAKHGTSFAPIWDKTNDPKN